MMEKGKPLHGRALRLTITDSSKVVDSFLAFFHEMVSFSSLCTFSLVTSLVCAFPRSIFYSFLTLQFSGKRFYFILLSRQKRSLYQTDRLCKSVYTASFPLRVSGLKWFRTLPESRMGRFRALLDFDVLQVVGI